MSLRPPALALPVALVALLALPRAARAQHARPHHHAPAPGGPAVAAPVDASARAAEIFQRGIEALDRRDWNAAIVAFDASFALRPYPIVALNQGIALRGAGRYAEAIDALERYLALGGASVPRDRAATVRNTIRELRAQLAGLRVASEPPGARLRIDGRDAGATPTPGPIALAGGMPHRFELELPGYVRVAESIDLRAGEQRAIDVRLAALDAYATLAVVGRGPPGTRVTIDGIDVGPAPVERQVQAGGHRVEATAPGRVAMREELLLAPRQRRRLVLRFGEPPLLARPAFWAVAGTVVAAGVAATAVVLVATADPFPGAQRVEWH